MDTKLLTDEELRDALAAEKPGRGEGRLAACVLLTACIAGAALGGWTGVALMTTLFGPGAVGSTLAGILLGGWGLTVACDMSDDIAAHFHGGRNERMLELCNERARRDHAPQERGSGEAVLLNASAGDAFAASLKKGARERVEILKPLRLKKFDAPQV